MSSLLVDVLLFACRRLRNKTLIIFSLSPVVHDAMINLLLSPPGGPLVVSLQSGIAPSFMQILFLLMILLKSLISHQRNPLTVGLS